MPAALQTREAHDGEQRSDVEARRGRIEADVRGDALLRERLRQSVGRLRDQTAPLQLVEKIRHRGNGLLYQSMTALRRIEGRPERNRGTVTRRAVLKALVATGAGVIVGPTAHGYLYGRHDLTITRVALPIAGLPLALAGVRIGFVTDVHRSRWVSHDDVARAVQTIADERPDLIVLGGDYVTWGDRQFVGPSADALGQLSAPHGVFAILGNHDDDHDMAAALARKHIQVLKDARTR